jgi:MATE family multidrug resistance protein
MTAPRARSTVPGGWLFASIRSELVTLLRLAAPVAASRLGLMVMGLTDALVVGRYSAVQLGYHALGWAPTGVAVTTVVGLLGGVQVMTARALGEGRPREAGAVLRRGLVHAAIMGMLAAVALAAIGPWFLHSVGLSKALADGATPVLLIFSLSLPVYAVSVAGSLWLEALSKPAPVTALMWIANAVNLGVDLVLVPGRFGVHPMGAAGGACATLIARIFLTLAILGYIALNRETRALGVFDKPRRDPKAEREQLRVGHGAGASNFFEVASFAAMSVIAGWVGGSTVAGWSVVLSVTSIIFMIPLGLSTAAAVMVASAYGARDRAGVDRAALTGVLVAAAFGGSISLLVWPNAHLIAAAYTRDPAVISLATGAVALSCLFFLADALQVVVAQMLRARGETWLPSFTHLASYIVVMIPLAWGLAVGLRMGLNGIVTAVIVASLVSAGLLLARLWVVGRRGI